MLSLFDVVDDTVLVKKIIFPVSRHETFYIYSFISSLVNCILLAGGSILMYLHVTYLCLFEVTMLIVLYQEMVASLKELAMDTYGRKVLLYILMPRAPTHFHPDIVKLLQKGDDNPHR